MANIHTVAVPSNAPGGLNAAPSAHFGHCDMYTVATVSDGEISDVRTVPNNGHAHGNCLEPVGVLADIGIDTLIAGGMGMRPLNGLQQAGIKVYYSANMPSVEGVLQAFAAGKLVAFGTDDLCKGNCGHH